MYQAIRLPIVALACLPLACAHPGRDARDRIDLDALTRAYAAVSRGAVGRVALGSVSLQRNPAGVRVVPAVVRPGNPGSIDGEVAMALAGDARLDAQHLIVSRHGSVIAIRGTVGEEVDAAAAIIDAVAVPGVTAVDLELKIVPRAATVQPAASPVLELRPHEGPHQAG